MSFGENWKISLVAVLMLAICGCGRPALIGTEAAVYSRGALYAVYDKDFSGEIDTAEQENPATVSLEDIFCHDGNKQINSLVLLMHDEA